MSDFSRYKGRLVPVDLEGKTLEEKCEEISEHEYLPFFFDSWWELLKSYVRTPYFLSPEGQLFRVEKENLGDMEDFIDVIPHKDGTYSFETRYFNRKANLHKMLEAGFSHMTDSDYTI